MTNVTNFNILKASKAAWENSAGGTGWVFAQVVIIFFPSIAIIIRSQNAIAASFVQLLITLFMHYYGWLHYYVWRTSYIIIILLIAFSLAHSWLSKR